MGLYTFMVLDEQGNPTGEELEEIFKWDRVPDILRSSYGRLAKRKGVEVVAKPADTSKFGINGVYNRGLGTTVNDWRHFAKIMAEWGLVRESDLGAHYFEDRMEAARQHYDREDAAWDKHVQAQKTSGLDTAEEGTPDYARAVERYWDQVLPAHEVWNSD